MNEHKISNAECSAQEARELLLSNTRTILIDTRSNREIYLGYIKGARFVPLGLIEQEISHLSGDREAPILIYCSSGSRTIPAAIRLREMGFVNARSIAGGYNAWLNKDYEIVSDSKLTVHQLNRFSRNMLLEEIGEEGQLKTPRRQSAPCRRRWPGFFRGALSGSRGSRNNRYH